MDVREAERFRYFSCERKRSHATKSCAEMECAGTTARPYKCSFCPDWHVGRIPSMSTLRRKARAIRVLYQKVEL